MKDRTRNIRQSPLNKKPNNKHQRRKVKRKLTYAWRAHRKLCKTCRDAPKMPDRVLTAEEIQKRRCNDGQPLFLTTLMDESNNG